MRFFKGNTIILRIVPLVLIAFLPFTSCGQVTQTAAPSDNDAIATIVAATLMAGPVSTSTIEEVPQTSIPEVPMETPTTTPSVTPSVTPTTKPTETQTDIPTTAPTVGSTPTPAPEDPVAALGSPDWKASLKDDTNWYTFEDEQSSIQVKNGALVLKAFKSNSYENWSMSYPKISDFYLELKGTAGDSCRGKDRFGLIFRAPDPNQGYLFGISCDGFYRVRAWDGETFTQFVSWQQSEHILTGPNQTNRIGVMADGAELSFYVNGHLLEEIQDDTYDKGVFGAYIAAAEIPGYTVSITQVTYWELP